MNASNESMCRCGDVRIEASAEDRPVEFAGPGCGCGPDCPCGPACDCGGECQCSK